MDWSALRVEHVTVLRSRLSELGRAPASINATLSALRGVARAAWQLGKMTAEDYHRIAGVKNVRGTRLPAGRALTPGEIGALLDICADDETAAGARDAAVIALLYGAGLRRSEAAELDLAHYDSTAGELKVRGKGDKERLVPLEAGVAAALNDWLVVRGTSVGPLPCPVRKGGRVELRRMSAQAIYDALLKRGRGARIPSLSPHDLRRTFREVHRVLRAGGELHFADFGKPRNALMLAASLPWRLFDGMNTTRDNVRGRLPTLLHDAGFAEVCETARFMTLFGTLSLYQARKLMWEDSTT